MKVNLAGLLKQAADCIDPKKDNFGYAYMLGEVADHIGDVEAGRRTLAEFTDFHCIKTPNEGAHDVE